MDQARGAWMIGGVVGIVGAVIAVVLGMIGAVCCLAGMANWVMPSLMGLVAGGLAAARADWSEVEPGAGTNVGLGLGVRAGAVAALLTALGYLVMAFLMPIVTVTINTLSYGGTDQLIPVLIGSIVGLAIGWGVALAVAVGGAVVGAGLGAASGAIVGSSMGNGQA